MYSVKGVIAGITQKSCVAAFPLWSLPKHNALVKISEKNMKDIKRISVACWRVHLRGGT